MDTVSGLLVLLDEDQPKIKEHALEKLGNVLDEHWAEAADSIALIEELSEDDAFHAKELAAFVASKIFYHLEEYDDSLRLALASGSYFDVGSTGEYQVTIVGKCIDKYIALRLEDATIDPRLESIVEGMFQKCYALGSYRQALGIALEAHRLDKVEDAIVRSGDQLSDMLSHCVVVCQTLVTNQSFRRDVFGVLVGLYEGQGTSCNFIELATCLHYLGEVSKYGKLLMSLIRDDERYLLAYQCAFDLMELQDQRFVANLLLELPSKKKAEPTQEGADAVATTEEEKTAQDLPDGEEKRVLMLCEILGDGITTAMYLDFLYRNNKTDPLALKYLKQAVEQGRKNSVLHNATIVAHGYMQAGTTVDSFLRNNLEWLGRASNWAKFSATASLGTIHKGNVKPSMQLLQPYLPSDPSAGVSQSPFSEGGALYALGLIHTCEGASSGDGTSALEYLVTALEGAALQEAENAREALQHGACLGIGLVAMSSGDAQLAEKLQDIVYNDNAVAGEAAALAMGMIMLGGGSKHATVIEAMISYAHDTQHEKIIRGLSLAVAMIMYGQEEAADTLVEQLCRDKDPLLRYGGMYTVGMAYAGSANNAAIRRLLHVAVSDVANDVRRAAVTSLGFVMVNVPDRLPDLIALLSESYNPHVRYGSCMALAIGCSHMDDPSEALALLEVLKDDKVDFVKQGALIACSMLLMQQNPETNPKAKALRKKLSDTSSDVKHSATMTRMGAILGSGIVDAGGRNVTIELMSRSGFTKPPAVVGMVLWTQYWYWYPMMHMLSLSFAPTALVGVNAHFDMPKEFSVDCDADLKQFDYPKPLEEKKEEKKVRVKTAVLSMTAKAKARDVLKRKDTGMMDVEEEETDKKGDDEKKETSTEEKPEDEEASNVCKLSNPMRVTRAQSNYIRFKTDSSERYTPVYKDASHKTGIVVLKDNKPDEPEDVVKVAVPPTGDADDDDDVTPPEPFEWTEP
mmetsp:Transcript_44931/g.71754  ORF Transcript_44931/g.71754 Transcript_44931/m.71754 type:complete len:969 (+) Transcript_44931:186-3092(+)